MKTLYVRINPNTSAARFFRCGVEFGRDWRPVHDVDAATARRLEEEQMLEVTDTDPEANAARAGDSATAPGPADRTAPPAAAPDSGVVSEPAVDPSVDPAVDPSTDGPQEAQDGGKPSDLEVLAERIKAAIRALDKDDPALWTVTGQPKTEAIAAVTGWPVTAAERAAALDNA